jgi:hypothetical protein
MMAMSGTVQTISSSGAPAEPGALGWSPSTQAPSSGRVALQPPVKRQQTRKIRLVAHLILLTIMAHVGVERQRRATSPPLVSDARPPNRTCTFRYASGSPGTMAKAGIPAPLIKLMLNAEEPSFVSSFIRVHGCFLRHHSLSIPCPPLPCTRLSRAPTTTQAPPLAAVFAGLRG